MGLASLFFIDNYAVTLLWQLGCYYFMRVMGDHFIMGKEMLKEIFNNLSNEDLAKVLACENISDLCQLAKDEGFDLTKEQLDAIKNSDCFSVNEQSNI